MKSDEQLLLEIISAQNAEVMALRCAVAHLQQHKDGFFPRSNLDDAVGRKTLAKEAWRHRTQERQLAGC